MGGETADGENIVKLYKNYEILDNAKDITKHEKEYLEILAAVKGSMKEKRLASQFIAKYFKCFPTLTDQSLEAQLDLCEDDDISIRKQAIKDLSSICKENKEQVPKISDILAQLLQAEDASELSIVHQSLQALLKIDAKGTLHGIYSQLLTGDDTLRERCIKFLTKYLLPLDRNLIDKQIENFLIVETKKVLQDVTGDEFVQLMQILNETRLSQTAAGHQEIVNIIMEQAEMDQPFDPKDVDQINRIMHCTYLAMPHFWRVNSDKFVTFLIEQVLSKLDEIPEEINHFKFLHLDLLKMYAECCSHLQALPNAEDVILKTLNLLFKYVTWPRPEDEMETNLQFSHIETILYALYRIGKVYPKFIPVDSEAYKNLKQRLQFVACSVQGYMKPLRAMLMSRGRGAGEEDEEGKILRMSLKVVASISAMIKDLFRTPLRFNSSVVLSWKPTVDPTGSSNVSAGEVERKEQIKRPRLPSGTEGGANKHSRTAPRERELYQPPGGKFSGRVMGGSQKSGGNWNSGNRSGRGYRGSGSRWKY